MLDPDYLLHISEGAEDIAEKLHNDIISRIVERVMLRIGRGDDYLLTAQDKWQIENLQQAGYLLEDIQKDIAKATKLQQTEIKEAMEDAGVIAMEYDDKIYRDAGISEVAPVQHSPHMVRLMQRNYEATLGEWTNFTRTTADAAQQLLIGELDRAYNLISTGALSYTAAVREVIKTVASIGVVVTYPSGHKDTLETATMRAVRTGIAQATAQVQLARMEELEHDLVIVSSHMGARPSHAAWQGKIYSRVGKKYPNFAETTGYGTVTGLCGANCRHSFGPYFEGMENPYEKYDSEENQKQYEKEQYQRTLERKIRKTKQETIALKKAVDECEDEKLKFELDMDYQKKAALLQRQNKDYKEYCDRNELKPLSERLEVARWDRKQAAAARGAAKRYESAHGERKRNFKEQSLRTKGGGTYGVDWRIVKTKEYTERFEVLSRNEKANMLAAQRSRNALSNRSGKNTEEIYAISLSSGKDISSIIDQHIPFGVKKTDKFIKDVARAEGNGEKVLLIHNHPRGLTPSVEDLNELLTHNNAVGITVGHDGSIYFYSKPSRELKDSDFAVAFRKNKMYNGIRQYEKAMEELAKQFDFEFRIL